MNVKEICFCLTYLKEKKLADILEQRVLKSSNIAIGQKNLLWIGL